MRYRFLIKKQWTAVEDKDKLADSIYSYSKEKGFVQEKIKEDMEKDIDGKDMEM